MNLWFDLKYAWRLLLKMPGYSLLCVVVVSLSIGLAMFTYESAYSQALKPLPFPGSERWLSVKIAADATATPRPRLDAYTYQELLKRTRTVNHLGAFSSREAVLSEGQASSSLRAAAISPALLAAMQVAPQMGRIFDAADSQPGAAPAVILSFDTWRNYFASDLGVVGKQARIDGQSVQIVGVMPKDFYAFRDFELWVPLQLDTLAKPGESTMTLSALVVLGKDQNAAVMLNEMKPVVEDVNRDYPKLFDAGRHLALFPARLLSTDRGHMQVIAMSCFIAVAVLLLACVNISMIFFARLLERSRELALRTALGSSRWRLLRQCLLETVFVVLLGLLLGIVLAALGTRWGEGIGNFQAQILAMGRTPDDFHMRPGDLLVAAIAATVLWLLSTLIPAWHIAKQDPATVLAGIGKGAAGSGSAKSASLLVGLQVIVSCLVLVICANVVLAVKEEVSKPMGLTTAQVMISTHPTVFDARYSAAPLRLRYWDELTASIKSRMAGADIAYTTAAPTDPTSVPVAIEHREGAAHRGTLALPVTVVSDNYFELLGLRLLSGRLFDSTDDSISLGVAIVDENIVKHYWPHQSVLGQRIQLRPTESGPFLTIVGVVSAVAAPYSDDGVIYQSLRQAAPAAFQLLAKGPPSVADSRVTLRAAAFAVDRDLPLHNLQMLDEFLVADNLDTTALVPVFSVVAAITVILAATGLFGLISRSVAQRTQEVGVRRALGGTQWQVTAMFLRQGALYLSIGVGGGCLGIVITNLISASIPNALSRVVPVSLGVFGLMALVIFVASYLPSRRAVALEPGDALRYE